MYRNQGMEHGREKKIKKEKGKPFWKWALILPLKLWKRVRILKDFSGQNVGIVKSANKVSSGKTVLRIHPFKFFDWVVVYSSLTRYDQSGRSCIQTSILLFPFGLRWLLLSLTQKFSFFSVMHILSLLHVYICVFKKRKKAFEKDISKHPGFVKAKHIY